MKQLKKTKAAPKRKWYTMTELRQLTFEELVNMAIPLGGSEEWRETRDRADLLTFIMNKQFELRDKGVDFEKGGER